MERWPHQVFGVSEALAGIARGERRLLVTTPTGGGKTRMMLDLAEHYLAEQRPVSLYTNRRLLIEQTSRVLAEAGYAHGIRAARYDADLGELLQVSSIHTEHSRSVKRKTWSLHGADLVLIDEAHLQTDQRTQQILAEHLAQGAAVVGFTATPLGLKELYDRLIVAGTVSELRACGALVYARHYGPDEPDPRDCKTSGEDLTEKENVSAIMREGIFGRVLEWFRRLNPDQKPTILFAPGVRESLWFAEQFQAAGIAAAHIDGEDVWIAGQLYRTSRERRQEVLHGSQQGDIKVISNRFCLREGVDAPWLCHGVFACVIGSVQSYLQAGGRLLRRYPGLESVCIQDHGGNWHRHGSLNADRIWDLDSDARDVSYRREEALRKKACAKCGRALIWGPLCGCGHLNVAEPFRCPGCGLIVTAPRCRCGWEAGGKKKSRPVVQSDGTLREMTGDVYRRRAMYQQPDGPARWERMYWRACSKKWQATFRQAFALFAQENNWRWPDRSWPLMPLHEQDEKRRVADVPMDRLVPKEQPNA